MGNLENWTKEGNLHVFNQYVQPLTDGPASRLPLPPRIMENLKLSVSSFPDLMLLCSTLSIETIRNNTTRMKIPRSNTGVLMPISEMQPDRPKWKMHYRKRERNESSTGSGGGPLDPPSPLTNLHSEEDGGSLPPWSVIKNVFPGGTEYLCNALYAHIVAYIYLTALNPRASLTRTSRRSNPREQDDGDVPRRSESSTMVPIKAASILGMPSPVNQGPSQAGPSTYMPPMPYQASSPMLPQSQPRGGGFLLRQKKSIHQLFGKKSTSQYDLDTGIYTTTTTSGSNRLQKQPQRGISSSQSNYSIYSSGGSRDKQQQQQQQQTFFDSASNLSYQHKKDSYPLRPYTSSDYQRQQLPHSPTMPGPSITAPTRKSKSSSSNRDPTASWAPLSNSESVDARAGGDQALRELQDLRLGLTKCIARLVATLQLSSGYSSPSASPSGTGAYDAGHQNRACDARHQKQNDSRYSMSPLFPSLSNPKCLDEPKVEEKGDDEEENGPLPPGVQVDIDPMFLRSLCELVRCNEELLRLR